MQRQRWAERLPSSTHPTESNNTDLCGVQDCPHGASPDSHDAELEVLEGIVLQEVHVALHRVISGVTESMGRGRSYTQCLRCHLCGPL